MRWYVAFAVSALASCVPSTSGGDRLHHAGADAAERDITAFADEFDRAQLTKDRAALERMVSPDLIFIDSSGQRRGKKEFIDGWTSPGDSYDPITLVDRVIVALGADVAIVSAETTLSGTSDGTRFASRFRFADTFRRANGQWRAVHIQVTRLPSQDKTSA